MKLIIALLPACAWAGCTLQPSTCYVDDNKRVLNGATFDGALSREYCAQFCKDKGFSLAGVEFKSQCFCDNKLRSDAKPAASGCSMGCSAAASEKCGGNFRIDVFNFTCSGPPVPEPKPPPYINNPCLNKSSAFASQPWCNASLSVTARVADMVQRLTLAEKIAALDTTAPPLPSLGLNAYNWWSEATHGISHVRNDNATPYESNFAFPITTGMSFNRTLWRATGAQIAREGRAFMNAGNAWSTYWAPVVNLAREPRWGRNIETPGEDPYLSGEYATEFVRGFQDAPEAPGQLLASACCKHYVANEMEHSTVSGETWTRHNFDANISQQDLVDSYMLPFQACVEKGKVSSLMCSYNAVNGVPSCANKWLLTTVAREAWGFDGYITSDCGAVSDVFNNHHYTKTPEEDVQAVLAAGTDVDCTNFVGQHGQSALDKKLISEADIDARLKMLFRVRMRLAHFDPPGPLQAIKYDGVACTPYAKSLAADGVTQGATLLKNDDHALPLKKASIKKLAVLGPNANLGHQISSYYGGNNCAGKYPSLLTSLNASLPSGTVDYQMGVPSVMSSDTSGVAAAAAAAKTADATLLVLGTDLSWAHEEHDAVGAASAISLSVGQLALLNAVAGNASKPIVVITLTATPLDLTPVLSNPKVGAVLHLGQPSVQTGGALPILFGERSPAGRTIQTVYPSAYGDMISIFDFNMRPGPSVWPRPDCKGPPASCARGTNPGRTYRFYTGKAVVPFGFGLSYSSFKYTLGAGTPRTLSLAPLATLLRDTKDRTGATHFPSLTEGAAASAAAYLVHVTNTGTVDADDAVLGFLTPPGAGKDGVPLKQLFGFERVHVPAGKTVSVYLYPSLNDFAYTAADGTRAPLTGTYTVSFGVTAPNMGYVEAPLEAVMDGVVEEA